MMQFEENQGQRKVWRGRKREVLNKKDLKVFRSRNARILKSNFV